MTLAEIKAFLEENKNSDEVKKFYEEIYSKGIESDFVKGKISEEVKKALELYKSGDGKKELETKIKEAEEAAFKKFKEKHKIKDIDPKEEEYENRIKALEEDREKMKRESLINANRAKFSGKLTGFEKLADLLILDDESKTKENVELFSTLLEGHTKSKIEEALRKGSYVPPIPGANPIPAGDVDLTKMTDEEVKAYMKTLK